ncbi:hypothetical protein DLM75_05900 [Leptospira stimsonii]|uniref:Uncharacterized protein n=1 Tax=Leptospira stimsonii TaxID=2202203 RepID=A0A396ZGA6_9LEPT|nr:hypothetical protein DLM75_05900 [Leptospira stimsonii]
MQLGRILRFERRSFSPRRSKKGEFPHSSGIQRDSDPKEESKKSEFDFGFVELFKRLLFFQKKNSFLESDVSNTDLIIIRIHL